MLSSYISPALLSTSYNTMPTVWLVSLVAALALLVARVVRVRQARFKRFDAVHARYAHLVANPSLMTYADAQEIMKLSAEYVGIV